MLKNKVGMGMPVYNGERYIEESLRAVLAQTFDDFHLVISDNASTDRTADICRDYAARDSRIIYIRNPVNVGAAKNYACCFKPTQCEYYRWTNSDDLPDPTLVEKCVKLLDANPDTVMAYGKTRLIDQHGALLNLYDDNMNLPQDSAWERFLGCINQIGLQNVIYGLMRREPLAKTNLLGNYLAADINLVVELSLYGKFREIPEVLFSRRLHPEASSWDGKDTERLRNFWDPSKRKLVMQTWKQIYEYNRAVLKSPVSLAHKGAILYYLVKKAFWDRKLMAKELDELIRYGILKRK